MSRRICKKLRVKPPTDLGRYTIDRGRDYIKLESRGDVYEVIDASTISFGRSTVGLKNGNIVLYGTNMNDTLLSLIHNDIAKMLPLMSMDKIREAWGVL